MLKVLVHGLSPNRGGVESFLLTYCSKIMGSHPDVHFDFVVYGDGHPGFFEELAPYQSKILHVALRTERWVENYRQLNSIVATGSYDLVWFNACTLSDITLLSVANRRGIPCVVHSHNSAPMGNGLNAVLHAWHKRRISQLAKMGIACSDYAAKFMFPDTFLDEGNCFISVNAVDCDRFAFSPADRERVRLDLALSDTFVIGHVGRFTDQKNHAFLVEIMQKVAAVDRRARLLLLGSGPLEASIRDQVGACGLDGKVVFAGSVPDAYRYYSAMDCFVFPSLYEGMPLALLEAQANGLPCIASSAISSMSFVTERAHALALESGASQWAEAVHQAAHSSYDRYLGAGEVASSGYGLEESAKRIVGLLYQAAGQSSHS